MKLYSIKPLEWRDFHGSLLSGIMGFTDYEIGKTQNGKWSLGVSHENAEDYDIYYTFDSLDEAKAKAQEDWESRLSQYLKEEK